MNRKEQHFFDDLYRRHYDTVYQFIARLIRDADAAYDITQETFTLAYTHLAELQIHQNAAGWLYKAARNLSMNYLRLMYHKHLSEEALTTIASQNSTEETVIRHFFPDASLSKWLSEEEIAIITDRFEFGYSLEETAARHDLTYAACKMRMSRIYQKLRKHPEILLLLVMAVEVLS